MTAAAVDVRGLSHAFGDILVIDDVSFAVSAGEVTALIGPTGCGKSTVLRVLAGLLVPRQGTARIGEISAIGALGHTGYMPQADTLLPWKRALENAVLGAEIRGVPTRAARQEAGALFTRFGLGGFEQAWPSQLSGGMRQRVALLRTVMTGAGVLLLDEPLGALDAITRTDLQGWLADLIADTGNTVVLVTHDVDEAMRLADEVLVMSARPGRIVDRLRITTPRPRTTEDLLTSEMVDIKRRMLLGLSQGR